MQIEYYNYKKQLKQFIYIYITLTRDKNHAQSISKLKENHLSRQSKKRSYPGTKKKERKRIKKLEDSGKKLSTNESLMIISHGSHDRVFQL